MNESPFIFESKTGAKLFSYKWLPEGMPRAVVQIIHGMGEHAGRYRDFARFLTEQGFAVFSHDHRGHGKTGEPGKLNGFFAPQKGWDLVIEDTHEITRHAQGLFPGLPHILIGHSMGSFVARCYAMQWGGELAGLLLSGTGGAPTIVEKWTALTAINSHLLLLGSQSRCDFMYRFSVKIYNKKFQAERSGDYNWLSRDPEIVCSYNEDPMCGFIPCAQFFEDMVEGILRMNNPEEVAKTPKMLPVLFLSGGDDPVGDFGRGVQHAFELFKAAGMKHADLKLYPGARHEIFNEINRDEVYCDALMFIETCLRQHNTH